MKKRGFIPINTNWFDRLFIGVISYVALQLFWMRFLESLISINFAIGIGIAWIIYVIWNGYNMKALVLELQLELKLRDFDLPRDVGPDDVKI